MPADPQRRTMASVVTMPDMEPDRPSSATGVKRRRRDSSTQESKRPRIAPGKSSPTRQEGHDASQDKLEPRTEGTAGARPEQAQDERRKSGSVVVANEKQRSKRLFGALLGNLNQPGDRTSKRRQEIEARRKAELQRQDDERLEDKRRSFEAAAAQRVSAQKKVDEQDMRTRHQNMLYAANFLQTTTEPKLYYRPWDLRADEEDRIDDQIKDAEAQVARQVPTVGASDDKVLPPEQSIDAQTVDGQRDADGNEKTDHGKGSEEGGDTPGGGNIEKQQTPAKSTEDTDVEKPKPNTVLNSDDDTADSANEAVTLIDQVISHAEAATRHGKAAEETEEMDDGDHVVIEGDEDSVIY